MSPPKEIPSLSDRVKLWNAVYDAQGMRWGLNPSLCAHMALPYIEETTGGTGSLIDIGCGYGRDLLFLRGFFPQLALSGLEPATEALQLGQQVFGAARVRTCVHQNLVAFSRGAINGNYQIILANYLFHLFSKHEVFKALRSVACMLAPKGRLIASFVSTDDRHYGKGRRLGSRVYRVVNGIPWRFSDEAEIRAFCRQAGLRVEILTPYKELELVNKRSDTVDGLFLVASK
jgi:SAM-dependent methyltransferase